VLRDNHHHGSHGNGNGSSRHSSKRTIQRERTGKPASIATRDVLDKLVLQQATGAGEVTTSRSQHGFVQRVLDMFQCPAAHMGYLNAATFAQDLLKMCKAVKVTLETETRVIFVRKPRCCCREPNRSKRRFHPLSPTRLACCATATTSHGSNDNGSSRHSNKRTIQHERISRTASIATRDVLDKLVLQTSYRRRGHDKLRPKQVRAARPGHVPAPRGAHGLSQGRHVCARPVEIVQSGQGQSGNGTPRDLCVPATLLLQSAEPKLAPIPSVVAHAVNVLRDIHHLWPQIYLQRQFNFRSS
jgi:hypothetical protein